MQEMRGKLMAKNKRYYWLKLKEGFFKEKEMKKLRKIAGGDTYTIIYLKILLLSLQNNGKIYFDGIEDDFAEEIALEIDEETDNVRFTLIFLEKYGLLTQESEDTIYLESIEEMIGSETASTRRSRKHRENQKTLQCNAEMLQCNTDATKCNTEKEIEKEIEKEKEKEKSKIDYQQIADMYNETCVSFPKVTKLSENRKKAIRARLRVYTIEDFKQLFEMAEASSFLKGQNPRNWSANFDWLINDNNMAKTLDGNYIDRDNRTNQQRSDNNEQRCDARENNGREIDYARTIQEGIESGLVTEDGYFNWE